MLVEALEEGAAEGDDNHGDDDDGENGVRGEQCEIDGANPSLTLEGDVTDAVMVDDIGDEEGGDHEFFVQSRLTGTNRRVASGEQNGAGAVEGGLECGVREHEKFSVIS